MTNPAETCFKALTAARDVLRHFPENTARRDVWDGLRIIAGCLSLPPFRRRVKKGDTVTPAVVATTRTREDLYDELMSHLQTIEECVRLARLPERRDWIYQNAITMARESAWTLRPPHHKTKTPVAASADDDMPEEEADSDSLPGKNKKVVTTLLERLGAKLAPDNDKQLNPVGGGMLRGMLPSSKHQPAINYIVNGK